MFDFITSAFRTVFGLITGSWQSAINSVVQFIQQMFRTTYQYHHTIYVLLQRQWARVAGATRNLNRAMLDYFTADYAQWARLRRHDIPFLENWITWLGGTLRTAINVERRQRQQDVNLARAQAHNYTHSVLIWVVIHVLGFLYRILSGVLSWIGRIGSTMWYYFTHLDKFAELLFWHFVTALEKFAWDAAKRLGTFFLSLIVHHLIKFVTLVEAIIVAVLE